MKINFFISNSLELSYDKVVPLGVSRYAITALLAVEIVPDYIILAVTLPSIMLMIWTAHI